MSGRLRVAEASGVSARQAQPWLGTHVEIEATGPDRECVEAAIAAGFAAIAAVHRALSGHTADSELACVNRSAARSPQTVSDDFAAVLRCALTLARRSAGVFDPTVGGELAALGYLPARETPPSPRASWRDVHFDDRRVRFALPLALDFDGIAKGYAVDRAVAVMTARGIARGVVNAGGDLRVWGGVDQLVHVRTGGPQGGVLPLLVLSEGAVATSAYGGQRAAVEGRFRTPLVDPRSQLPVMSTRTVSVIAPTCMVADALTKVVALRGSRAARLLADYDAEASILSPAGGRWRCTRLPGAAVARVAA